MSSLNKTSLYNNHIELKAKILPFAGYMMPINYPHLKKLLTIQLDNL